MHSVDNEEHPSPTAQQLDFDSILDLHLVEHVFSFTSTEVVRDSAWAVLHSKTQVWVTVQKSGKHLCPAFSEHTW